MSIQTACSYSLEKEPIAITGIGCRFPGEANDPDSFWKLLANRVDAITEIPKDRWNMDDFYHPMPGVPGKSYSRWGGFIRGIDQFDPEAFGISPREAAHIDPQQRVLLEVAWEALQDGGHVIESIAGSDTGVFIGISTSDYAQIQARFTVNEQASAHSATGGASSIAANRISYCLNLRGPSIAVDTACSSSLVAMHLACTSLLNNECSLALAGGVNIIIMADPFIAFCAASMLSADGRCKAFDASANGFVRGEGAGLVVLKRLSRALVDGDRIYAVIAGSGVNQDGRTNGIAMPSLEAQEALLTEVYGDAGIDPREVDYVEAHGTGTLVGDPIEALAIGKVLSSGRPEGDYCIIGSVKTNIGHLEAGAGVAGVVKTALALSRRMIPPNVHFRKPNPAIPFDSLKLRVPTSLEPWPVKVGPAIAGVNSFGFGGTNAHVVLREYRHETENHVSSLAPKPVSPLLLPLSARTPTALKSLAEAYHAFLESHKNNNLSLPDLCYSASARRDHFDHRLSIVAHDAGELRSRLEAFLAGETRANMFSGCRRHGQALRIVFVFPGQGPQWWAMGRELLEQEPVFRETIFECDRLLGSYADWSLLGELSADEASSRLQETAIAQPALFSLQVGLAALWKSWGVEPNAVVGHSVGEVAAAYVAGALRLNEALRVIFHRGRCMDFAGAKGRMLAVGLPLEEAEKAIRGCEELVSVAAVNSPSSVTLSGDPPALEEISGFLVPKGIFCRFLRVEYAFHSVQMEPLKHDLLASLAGLDSKRPVLPIVSTVTGKPVEGRQFDENYWWRNVREKVRFAEAVGWLVEQGHDVFVELSPQPVLAGSISESLSLQRRQGMILPSLRRGEKEKAVILGSLGALYALGKPVEWKKLWPQGGACVPLPRYPWERQFYWNEPEESRVIRLGERRQPLIKRSLRTAEPIWEVSVDKRLLPFLEDHKVHRNVVLPAAFFLEMGLEAAREIVDEGTPGLEDVQFQRILFLPDQGDAPVVQLLFKPAEASFSVHSRSPGSGDSWTLHTIGYMRTEQGLTPPPIFEVEKLQAGSFSEISSDEFYRRFSEMGLQYGPSFRCVERIWKGHREAFALLRVPADGEFKSQRYWIHPALLDGCFQVLSEAIPLDCAAEYKALYLPVQVARVRVFGRAPRQLWSHARLRSASPSLLEGDIRIYDDSGAPVMEIEGFRCQSLGELADEGRDLENWLYEVRWRRKSAPQQQKLVQKIPIESSPALGEVARAVEGEVRTLFDDLGWRGILSKANEALDRLAAAYVIEGMRELGCAFKPGEQFTVDSLVNHLKIGPNYRRLTARFLRILEREGGVEKCANAWLVNRALAQQDPQKLWQGLLAEFPAFFAELMLVGQCGAHLPSVLRGEMAPLQVIFPGGSTSLVEQFYQDSPSFRFYNIAVQKTVERLVKHISAGKRIRILEIGAGTGGMTTYVLPKMPADRSEYVFSDLSSLFLQRADQKFHDCAFLKSQLLDIQENPLEQLRPHSFDLILASDVLHATADLRASLRNIQTLLSSQGVLILLEVVEPHEWIDLVFGLTEGWWNFRDYDLRPDYPLIPRSHWKDILRQVGFTDIDDISFLASDEEPGQALLLARGPVVEEGAESRASETVLESVKGEKGVCLVFADGCGISKEFARVLGTMGETCISVRPGDGYREIDDKSFQISPTSPEDMERLLHTVSKAYGAAWHGTVHFWSLDIPPPEELTLDALQEAEALGCYSVLRYVQAALKLDRRNKATRLVLVTRNAQPVGVDQQALSIAQAPLIGLGRVVANESSQLRVKLVDLGPEASGDEIQSLAAEVAGADDGEMEIALRQEACFAPRVEHAAKKPIQVAWGKLEGGAKRPFRLEITKAGTIDRLALREAIRRNPGPGEVEIEIVAASLNFRDVMKALGVYPAERQEDTMLGDECAGRIVSVGEGVKDFNVGDEVAGIALGSFSSYVTTSAESVMHKPANLTFAEAATIPIAYLTAYYSLQQLGQLKAGERVLIHSGAGGVGLAAIGIAIHAGAEIFATAGTPEKREFLRLLGVQHVLDSRSLLFADQVLERTDGRGVDVVLNSLAGRAIAKSLSCLAPFGRFLELGKRDIYQDSKLGLWAFRKNLSFFAVDLGRLMAEKPALVRTLVDELSQRIDRGEFRPIPYRLFSVSRIRQAFRYMAQGRHIGKLVVSMGEGDPPVEPSEGKRVAFRSDGTYLITGGFGGFGLTVAKWIVENGGCNLALVGRSGAGADAAKKAVEALRNSGARVLAAKADITSVQELRNLLAEIDRTLPPLIGVFHAAMVLDDGILLELDPTRFRKVTAPKIDGTWNLHMQTLDKPLDYFVLFSSVSSLIGNPGQGNYVAANAFLDAFAYYRRSQGLPAVTINWGRLGEVGYLAGREQVAEHLAHLGVEAFAPKEAMDALGRILQRDQVQVGVIRADWRKLSPYLSSSGLAGRFSALAGETAAAQTGSEASGHTREVLLRAKAEDRQPLLEKYIQEQAAQVLGISAGKVDVNRPLNEVGLDSLMAIELKNRIESDLRMSLPVGKLMQGPTIQIITSAVLEQLTASAPESSPPPILRQDPDERLTKVEVLSDDEVDAALRELLGEEAGHSGHSNKEVRE
ncbi:MAG: SDR family NAD(P)-dependent oxidoreductase [Deltaproteobacteria bacterium]|nr:SDR family NAD(P)-dependent oxidoreductase [Deltaproteobacteria bacterium]